MKLNNHEIKINIRGGKQISVFLTAETIVPEVYIKEEIFDFGSLTFGSKAKKEFEIYNESEIEIHLIVKTFSNNQNMQENLECIAIDGAE